MSKFDCIAHPIDICTIEKKSVDVPNLTSLCMSKTNGLKLCTQVGPSFFKMDQANR